MQSQPHLPKGKLTVLSISLSPSAINTRYLGAGKIIGGVISLVFGIIIFAASMFFYNVQTGNLEYCNSLAGGLQQGLDPQTAQQCSNAGGIRAAAIGGMLLGGALALVGLILVIVGAVQHGTKKRKIVSHESDPAPDRKSTSIENPEFSTKSALKVYCRYCGKERPITGDVCPLCGRSSLSVSTNMKQCKVCEATMAEDSKFCGNCGTEFQEPMIETVSEPLQEFEEPRLGVKMPYPVGWKKEIKKDKISFYPLSQSESEDIGITLLSEYTDKRTIHDFMAERINSIQTTVKDFKLLESSSNVTLSGKSAYKLVYLRSSEEFHSRIKRIEFGTVIDKMDRAYIVNAGSEIRKYSKYFPTIEKVISSIDLTKI